MTEAHPLRKEPHVKYESLKFWITEKQLDQLYDMAFDRSDWGESPHDNKPLNKLCDEITSQKLNNPAKSDAVLDELIAHFGGFENQKEFRYSASDIIQYLTNFKKLVELRQQEREP